MAGTCQLGVYELSPSVMNRGIQLEWIQLVAVEWRGRKAVVRPNLETAVQQLTIAERHKALQQTEPKQLATGLE